MPGRGGVRRNTNREVTKKQKRIQYKKKYWKIKERKKDKKHEKSEGSKKAQISKQKGGKP